MLHRLACEILGSPPGVKPEPSALEVWGLNSWIIREVQDQSLNNHVRRIMLIDISSSRYLFNACVLCPPVLLGCNFLLRSKHLFISWLQSLSTVIGFPFLQTLSSIYYLESFWWRLFWQVIPSYRDVPQFPVVFITPCGNVLSPNTSTVMEWTVPILPLLPSTYVHPGPQNVGWPNQKVRGWAAALYYISFTAGRDWALHWVWHWTRCDGTAVGSRRKGSQTTAWPRIHTWVPGALVFLCLP